MGAGNFVPTGILFPDRPSTSHSLYLLSYPGPLNGWQYIDVLLRVRDMFLYREASESYLDLLCEQEA